MYHHIITFNSKRAFNNFIHITSDWLQECGFVQRDEQLDTETAEYRVSYCTEAPIDKERQIDIQQAHHLIANTSFNRTEADEAREDLKVHMKTLAELQLELELGMWVYPTTNHDVDVHFVEGWYIFGRSLATDDEGEPHGKPVFVDWSGHAHSYDTGDGGVIYGDGYQTIEALLADWPVIASQPVWSPVKTIDRLRYDKQHHEEMNRKNEEDIQKSQDDLKERQARGADPFEETETQEDAHSALKERMKQWPGEHKSLELDTPLAELGLQSEEFPDAKTLTDLISNVQANAQAQDTWTDESVVPLASRLGQDVERWTTLYFPDATVTCIESRYSRGVFVGDYSIHMQVHVTHPTVQQVEISFTNEDVPGRPATWQDLIDCPEIRLFLNSITLLDPLSHHPTRYGLPGMYQKEIQAWCKTHDDGTLYGRIETPEMFIVTTQLMDAVIDEIEGAAKKLVNLANEKREQERDEWEDLRLSDSFNEKPF